MDRPYRYGQNTKTTDEEEMSEKDMEIVSLKMAMRRKDLKKEVVRRKSDKGILAGTLHNVLRGSRKKYEKYGHSVRWLNFCCNAQKTRCFRR